MIEPPADLAALHADLWDRLARSTLDRRASFHTGVVATTGMQGPRARTVVLRDVHIERRELVLHTDTRAAKLEELRRDPRIAWVFHDPRSSTQVRVDGVASMHVQDEIARERWERTGLWSRRSYLVENAPGAEISEPGSGLPVELEGRAPSMEESAGGLNHFGVVVTRATALEWLWLSAKGHRRARWEYEDGAEPRGRWLVP